jgi:hypothetical protein
LAQLAANGIKYNARMRRSEKTDETSWQSDLMCGPPVTVPQALD